MTYRTELHCHTSEFSRCARQGGAETAEAYIACGYTTVVLTNHFCTYYPEHTDHRRFVDSFFGAAEVMRQAAGDRLTVLTGMELTLSESGNDYLVYGLTREMLLDMPNIYDLGIRGFYPVAKELGLIVVQAHPLRFGMRVTEPWYLDGVEVYNGSHDPFCNDAAELWASLYEKKYMREEGRRVIRTSGSDRHGAHNRICGGIETDSPITCMAELTETLRSGDYRLIGPDTQ